MFQIVLLASAVLLDISAFRNFYLLLVPREHIQMDLLRIVPCAHMANFQPVMPAFVLYALGERSEIPCLAALYVTPVISRWMGWLPASLAQLVLSAAEQSISHLKAVILDMCLLRRQRLVSRVPADLLVRFQHSP